MPPVIFEAPACWNGERVDTARQSLRVELQAYGVENFVEPELAAKNAITIRLRGGCGLNLENIELEIQRGTRVVQQDLQLDDVDASAIFRVLALAVAAFFVEQCAHVGEPSVEVIRESPRESSPGTHLEESLDTEAGTTEHSTLRLSTFAQGEMVWYISPSTVLRGLALGLVLLDNSYSYEIVGVLSSGSLDHPLGSIELVNTGARASVGIRLWGRTSWVLRGDLSVGGGMTSAKGRAVGSGTLSDSIRGFYWCLRAGPVLHIPFSARSSLRMQLHGGAGGGVPLAAGGGIIGSTSGASVVAAAGLSLDF